MYNIDYYSIHLVLMPFLFHNSTTSNQSSSLNTLPYISSNSKDIDGNNHKYLLFKHNLHRITTNQFPIDDNNNNVIDIWSSNDDNVATGIYHNVSVITRIILLSTVEPMTYQNDKVTSQDEIQTSTTTTSSPAVSTWLPVFDMSTISCRDDQFKCQPGGVSRLPCLYKWERCDGIQDCSDGSDERFCHQLHCYGNFECTSRTSSTNTAECVSLDKVCNGISDCIDGSDEKQCG